jgi:NADH-quinone oxidoreductase subunit M
MQSLGFGLLSAAIWLPIAFGAVLLATGRDERAGTARGIALLGAVLSFLVTIPLITGFDNSSAALQFVENMSWIERFKVRYHLGVDGISVWFVLITAFITVHQHTPNSRATAATGRAC